MRTYVAVVWAVLLSACGNSPSPTSPSTSSETGLISAATEPFPPPAPPGTERALSAYVREGTAPSAGARVFALAVGWYGGYTTEASATTGADGLYELPRIRAYAGPDAIGWILVGASKPGYFADHKWWLDFPADANLDLQLDPWRYITIGQTVKDGIGDDECAGLGYGGWYERRAPCARYAVSMPRGGTLAITVAAPVFEFDVDIVKPDGMFAAYTGAQHSPTRLTAPVAAGHTYEVRIAAIGAARAFELTTTLE